jgi:hypothetical protein
MNSFMESMAALQRLIDLGLDRAPTNLAKVAELRASVPAPVLGHFDRNNACGRKGVASVVHGVCSGCHLRVASGTVAMLKGAPGLVLCENCGAYLHYVPAVDSAADSAAAAAARTPVRPVSRRVVKAPEVAAVPEVPAAGGVLTSA